MMNEIMDGLKKFFDLIGCFALYVLIFFLMVYVPIALAVKDHVAASIVSLIGGFIFLMFSLYR